MFGNDFYRAIQQGCQFFGQWQSLGKKVVTTRGFHKDIHIFVERLWRGVKYEEVYLKAHDSLGEARASLGNYFEFYNTERRHQLLGRRTPDNVHHEEAARKAA